MFHLRSPGQRRMQGAPLLRTDWTMNPRIRDWRGRRVWVIGASTGIGAETARMLLAFGARVALSARHADALQEVAAGHRDACVLPLDVTRHEQVLAARDLLMAQWQGIDLVLGTSAMELSNQLVANGDGFGVGWYGAFETPGLFRSTEPAWNDLNLRELREANSNQKHSAIVILSETDKEEVETAVRERMGDLGTTRVIVRQGSPYSPHDLRKVGASRARSIARVFWP